MSANAEEFIAFAIKTHETLPEEVKRETRKVFLT